METQPPPDIHERVNKLLDNVQGLPTLPSMLDQMNKMMMNPRTSAKEIAQLISSDPSITSRVLRVVNSSFYGFPNRITTITHAIVILGFNTVKSIVLSSSIFELFKGRVDGGFNRNEFWKHSIGCGAAGKVLGKRLSYPNVEELFIAGLLHDVGKIVMDQYLQDLFQNVLDVVQKRDCLIMEAELEILGVTHADIGGWLMQKWNMAAGLIECIQFHHNPALADENVKAASIIHMADILTRALRFGSGGDNRMPVISDSAWDQLGLQTSDLGPIVEDVAEEIDKATVFLDFI